MEILKIVNAKTRSIVSIKIDKSKKKKVQNLLMNIEVFLFFI